MAKLANVRLRRDIIRVCRQMNADGINQGTSGNVSCRVSGGALITPSGIAYDDLSLQMIVEMDMENGYRGDLLPSSEWRMHMDIYRHRPDAQAIVHTHSTFATALSCLRIEIPAFHYMIAVAGGSSLRCADYATFGTAALSTNMTAALEDRTACLLANHGVIAFGPSLEKTLWRVGEIEALAKQYWATRQLGDPVLLDDEEIERVLTKFATYGRQMDELGTQESPAFELPVRRDRAAD